MILGGAFAPAPELNRMGNHGDLAEARRRFQTSSSANLRYLLENRYSWIDREIGPGDEGVELAAGIGVGRDFLHNGSLVVTDFDEGDWLDVSHVDATATPFESSSFDFVVIQNGIHHLAHPIRFFDEAARILRPGGLLLVQDVKCSLLQRALARLTRAEGYSYDIDVFDRDLVVSDPANPWSANNAVPDLLFDDVTRFERRVPAFKVVSQRYSECLVFLDSGGVTHKTVSVPLPRWALRGLDSIDRVLTRLLPSVFALQRSVVLRLREGTA